MSELGPCFCGGCESCLMAQGYSPTLVVCPGCGGIGSWETACCSGVGGCSCGGELVDMGTCRVCGGQGSVDDNDHNPRANLEAISGLHFAGTGPNGMFDVWPNRGGGK